MDLTCTVQYWQVFISGGLYTIYFICLVFDFILTSDQARIVRHRGREGKIECTCNICGAECESVVHVLWECPAYSSCTEGFKFKAKVKELVGDSFEQLSDIDKTAYVLGSELWEENFEDTLRLVKEFNVDVWDVRK